MPADRKQPGGGHEVIRGGRASGGGAIPFRRGWEGGLGKALTDGLPVRICPRRLSPPTLLVAVGSVPTTPSRGANGWKWCRWEFDQPIAVKRFVDAVSKVPTAR